MKIGYILKIFPKLSETFILNEIVELTKRGHEVYIFSISYPTESIVHPEIKKYDLLKRTRYPPSFIKTFSKLLKVNSQLFYKNRKKVNNIYSFLAPYFAKYFSKIIKKLDIDILHAHFADESTYTAMLISKLTQIPYTFTAHAVDIFVNPNIKLLREKMENASAVITPSYYNKNYLYNLTGIDKDKIHVIRACANIERFKSIKRNEDPFTILTIGRLVEKKGIKYGILAIKELIKDYPEVQYRIVGSGPLEKNLKDLVKSLNLENSVKFLGSLNSDLLVEELSKATIFILPCVKASNGDRDVCPLTLQEAMITKIPVVSTNMASIPELIENGKEGFLVKPKNIKQLATVIKSLLQDKEMRKKIGKNGRKKVEKDFNINIEVEKLLKIWKTSLSN